VNQALGRSRGGFSTKIHVVVDALGNPLDFVLTGGEVHDSTQAEALLLDKDAENILADKGYDSDTVVHYIESKGAQAIVPSRSNRKKQRSCDWILYKERHLVECFIGKLKHFRRVFSRFDKLAVRFFNFIQIASTLIWLR